MIETDVLVYGGTASAVMAAVQVARMNKQVVIVCPDKHLGGMSSSGLGFSDTGKTEAIGGLARLFYERVYEHYQDASAWRWQAQESYGNTGQKVWGKKVAAMDHDSGSMWVFEPHIAEGIFDTLIQEHAITVYKDEWLTRPDGVSKTGTNIHHINTLSGKQFSAKVFIDATYEGDLMAETGVSYHVGREANSVYNETWNGSQVGVLHHEHFFRNAIDPYVIPGEPASGLLPGISADAPAPRGHGDMRIQAYCYRMCLSKHPDNRVPFAKPDGYSPQEYELLARVFATGRRDYFEKFDPIPNSKTDTNNHGPVSTDYIGQNYGYPESSYRERESIINNHKRYQQGLMYFLTTDDRVPTWVRDEMSQWGLPADEFTDNDHWPHQLYIREARRMIGEFVMTERDVLGRTNIDTPVGMGSYTLDSHNTQRYVTEHGTVQNEGDVFARPDRPYQIDYGSLTPKASDCTNLLVPVCVSSSHIAYGSMRMEPVFMILGQSTATAAVHAIEQASSVQAIDKGRLVKRLKQDRQRLQSS
ncbi:MAG: FAD-dependent oxidoreductase [Deinococcota bacterium]